MRRGISTAVVLVLVAGGALGGGDAGKKEMKRFQGTWKVVKLDEGGEVAPADEAQKTEMTFSDDKISVKSPKGAQEATFSVDPSKKPAHIDIRPIKSDKVVQGIYKFEKKQLVICFVLDKAATRPTKFASAQKPRTTLVILERTGK